ncbi:hypothetical protein UAW_02504 [Enterococcus haemoperoxidus ATCC BAA-382]|uniref:Alternate signal-mediated exported protein n=1 Tax=Enterococcus haemoperoxidus ATCC BAA-382 TaxID=1158608 RepID=R2SZW2_9ENTE|nr:hypothetical protein [Enterococcus haemoperoxidus]EOH93554.1 hypothetical protein UAW_02504 [Enterococcus haemoperoxidus ATCC BAA-382]EOT63389.1 hypothetical protein I583_00189 [Enterococcus haemoperoxidus ATCC BAA-382]OJG50765.1 hypothetical protein RV06_GL001684 [Enterococcus haemoperoxidus]
MGTKKKKRKKSITPKKWVLIVLSVVLVFAIGTVLRDVYAANKSTDEEVNNFRLSDLKGTIQETFTPSKEIKIDTPITKKVAITNDQNQDMFVRLLVLPTIIVTDSEGEDLVLPASFKGEGAQIEIPFDTTDWIDGEDGYFYYVKKLKKNETSSSLFKQVTIVSKNIDEQYSNAEIKIEIKLEGVNSTAYTYRDAWWQGTSPTQDPRKKIDDQLKLQI